MSFLCKLGIHDWIFGYRYEWIVAKQCHICDKTIYFYPETPQDNIAFYDSKKRKY